MTARQAQDVPVRDAATVMLLRSGSQGLEVFALRRSSAMAFAAGAYAFPGGAVEEQDHGPLPWTGTSLGAVAQRLAEPADRAAALMAAAVRELFEETGTLLAAPWPDPAWAERARTDLLQGRRSFAEVLSEAGARLRADLLLPWSRWVTPAGQVRRFDARFFVAALPPGAAPPGLRAGEADRAHWVRPVELLREADQGRALLLLPTRTTLAQLAVHPDPAAVLAAAPSRLDPARRPDPPGRARPTGLAG